MGVVEIRYGGIPEQGVGPLPFHLGQNHDSSISGIFMFRANLQGNNHWRLAGVW